MSVHRQPAGTGRRGAMAASREAVAIEVGPSNPEDRFPPSSEAAELAKELESPFMTPEEAAQYLLLGKSGARALAQWRTQPGKGPRYRRHGRKVVYHRRALDRWSEEQERGSTLESA